MSQPRHAMSAERWAGLSVLQQMANIGSEVERALKAGERGDEPTAGLAFERALELFDLSLASCPRPAARREMGRARSELVAWRVGAGDIIASPPLMRKYYLEFALGARRGV